ncbi:MAG: hypothetical protein R3A80_00840 [Bdellovibrionota bacterium]
MLRRWAQSTLLLLLLCGASLSFAEATCRAALGSRAVLSGRAMTSELMRDFALDLRELHSRARLQYLRSQLETQLKNVAQLFKEGDLFKAFQLLNDDRVFEELPIGSIPVSQRPIIVLNSSELKQNPKVTMADPKNHENAICCLGLMVGESGFRGEIHARDVYVEQFVLSKFKTLRKSLWDQSLDQKKNIIKYRKEEIRMLFEEKLHALQLLNYAANNSFVVAIEGQTLKKVLDLDASLNKHPFVVEKKLQNGFAIEADAYAFMIKHLGIENVPIEYGIISGYPTRAIIDAELGRPWPQEVWESYRNLYGEALTDIPR